MPDFGTLPSFTTPTITLNSLASGSSSTSSTTLDNSSSKDVGFEYDLVLGSFTPGTAPFTEIHLLAQMEDGTNYADLSGATMIDTAEAASGASVKRIHRTLILPPGFGANIYKVALVNRNGATWAGSGNVFKCRFVPLT